jgi:phage major head subunit gpT-like protein
MSGPHAIARRIPVTGREFKPKFVSRDYGVQEWLDSRQLAVLRHYDFTVPVKKWSNGLQVEMDDLDDDSNALSLYGDEIASMGDDFLEHKHQQIIDLLDAGFGATLGTCYDGKNFFSASHQDHPEAAIQTNLSTTTLTATGWYECKDKMRSIRKPNGQFAAIRPNLVVIPSALEQAADELFKAPTLGNGASNTLFNDADVEVDPRLTSDTAWFAFDTTKMLKSIAHADRKAVGFRAKDKPDGEKMFDEDVAEYGGDGRYNAAYYFWQTAFGSDGTAAP